MTVDQLDVGRENIPGIPGWVAEELIDECNFPVKGSGRFPGMNLKTSSSSDVGFVLRREFAGIYCILLENGILFNH